MQSKFKAPLLFTVFALILSSFIGFVSGVSFLSILFRSSVLAVVSGFFVFAVREVLERFVPELFQTPDNNEEKSNLAGNNINISIDEPIELSGKDVSANETAESALKDENLSNEFSNKLSNDDIDDVDGKDTELAEVHSENSSRNADLSSDAHSVSYSNDSEQPVMDELPDLGEFSGYSPPETEFKDRDFTEQGIGAVVSSVDDTGSSAHADTNTMVKAIQTILKRDR